MNPNYFFLMCFILYCGLMEEYYRTQIKMQIKLLHYSSHLKITVCCVMSVLFKNVYLCFYHHRVCKDVPKDGCPCVDTVKYNDNGTVY